MRRRLVAVLLASGMSLGVVVSAGAAPVGYSARPAGGEFYSVDLGSASATQLGSTADIRGLAVGPNGTLYGVTAGETAKLVTVNKANGAVTEVGNLGYSQNQAGLSFTADGRLWTTRILGGDQAPSSLYEVNPATGAATLVGANGTETTISGLAGSCDGTLWGIGRRSLTSFLFRIDTGTGTATAIGTGLGAGAGAVDAGYGFDIDAAGVLWGLNSEAKQFTIDPVTGVAANIQSITGITDSSSISSLGIAPIVSCAAPKPPGSPAPPADAVTLQPTFTG